MSNLNSKFKKSLKEIEEKIEDKESLEFIKLKLFDLYNMFFEELEKQEEVTNRKTLEVLNLQQEMLERIGALEMGIRGIEKDIYCDEEDEFEVVCPYCNHEFSVEELKDEVTCPECKNIIELDWHSCEHDCDECHSYDHEEDNEDI